jgi:tetratricopeptide (TPR) repeat protein
MAQAAGIFVSHAHEDNAWCRAFVLALREAGADVWYDEHNLGYGVLGEEIERELKVRPIFIVILSPASVGKPWVRREMNAAVGLRDEEPDRIILPVVAEKTEIPLFWREYKRVSGPLDAGLTAAEAAGRVVHTMAIVPASVPVAPAPPVMTETAQEAWERGKGLRAQGRFAEALAAFERAITLEPEQAAYWYGKGAVLLDLQRPADALAAFERTLELDPQPAIAWNAWQNKIALLLQLGRTKDAATAKRQRDAALKPQ